MTTSSTSPGTATGSITIDGKTYLLESLSENAIQQIKNLRFADQEISRAQANLALLQTARTAYARVLSDELGQTQPVTTLPTGHA